MSATVSKILRGFCTRASMISIAGTTYSVARSTSSSPTPGPFSGLPSTKTSSGSTRGTMKRSKGTLAPSSIIIVSCSTPKSGSSICEDCCIAFDVSPILLPMVREPLATLISFTSAWIA